MENRHKLFNLIIFQICIISVLMFSCNGGSLESPIDNSKLPTVSTALSVNSIFGSTAISGGTITDDKGQTVTARGVCWSTHIDPTIKDSFTKDGSGIGTFSSTMTNLLTNTTYFVRAYATNATGTAYGGTVTFTSAVTVTDIDGNVYNGVTIGTQTWMVENLKTTKYRDGSAIPNISDKTTWSSLTTGAYYNIDNNIANASKFGLLYNWFAVTDTRNIAPIGWHVASDAEWRTLEIYLIANGYNYDGTTTGNLIAKSLAANTEWSTDTSVGAIGNNLTKNNKSGFTALPCGSYTGEFNGTGQWGGWWSTTENTTFEAWNRFLYNRFSYLGRSSVSKNDGISVRCVRD